MTQCWESPPEYFATEPLTLQTADKAAASDGSFVEGDFVEMPVNLIIPQRHLRWQLGHIQAQVEEMIWYWQLWLIKKKTKKLFFQAEQQVGIPE